MGSRQQQVVMTTESRYDLCLAAVKASPAMPCAVQLAVTVTLAAMQSVFVVCPAFALPEDHAVVALYSTQHKYSLLAHSIAVTAATKLFADALLTSVAD